LIRRFIWAVLSAFVLGALIAFAISLLRRPPGVDPSGYRAPEPSAGPTSA
jgi:hypothetical protein